MPSVRNSEHSSGVEVTQTETRKDDHIRINLDQDVAFRGVTTGLDRLYLPHEALPDINLSDVSTAQTLFGKPLSTPVFISSMTGGTEWAGQLNRTLAEAAQARGVAMGLGSMRVALERAETVASFQVRAVAPDIMLWANFGAVQLNYGYGVDACRRLVEMVEADALILHFNPLQEAVQPEGDTNFAGLLARIEAVARALPVPVIAKEVGWGFSVATVRRLADAGVAAIDVAGAGGTSWSEVEMHRAPTASHRRVAGAFIDWGFSTAQAIRNVREAAPGLPVFASGGLRNGIDAAKTIALGASLVGMASPFLKAAVKSTEAVVQEIDDATRELRIAMFSSGCATLSDLQNLTLLER